MCLTIPEEDKVEQPPSKETITATVARQRFASVINRVARNQTRVVVEKSGVPVAGIVSPDDLDRLDRERTERFAVIDEMCAAFRDIPAEEFERGAERTLAEVRADIRTGPGATTTVTSSETSRITRLIVARLMDHPLAGQASTGREERRPMKMPSDHHHDPRMGAAVTEMQDLIRSRFPTTTFTVGDADDPEGVYVRAPVDVEDTDEVIELILDRLVDLQVTEGLPIYVVPVRTPERIAAGHPVEVALDSGEINPR